MDSESETFGLLERVGNTIRNTKFNMRLYHALYRTSEYIGGETWGDNLAADTEFVKCISEENRKKENGIKILLLGSATPTSIKQVLSAIEQWKAAGLIKDGELTVVDLNSYAYDKLDPELKEKVKFFKMDVRELPFEPGSFDFITSDYLLTLFHRMKLLQLLAI